MSKANPVISEELKPCPFCGRKPRGFEKFVICQTPACYFEGARINRTVWNRRAAPEPEPEKVPWSRVKSVVKHADGYHITLRPNGFEVERKPLKCPKCNSQHVDRGEWAKRPHHKHLCEYCGHEWRVEPYTFGIAPEPDLTVGPEPAQGDRESQGAFIDDPIREGPPMDLFKRACDWVEDNLTNEALGTVVIDSLAAEFAKVREEQKETDAKTAESLYGTTFWDDPAAGIAATIRKGEP